MSLTKKDLQQISELLNVGFELQDAKMSAMFKENNERLITYIRKEFATKKDFKEIEKKFENLPTLEQFNDFKDSVLGAINKHEAELLIVSSRLSRVEERLEALESSKAS